jgi:hypothetical protein
MLFLYFGTKGIISVTTRNFESEHDWKTMGNKKTDFLSYFNFLSEYGELKWKLILVLVPSDILKGENTI